MQCISKLSLKKKKKHHKLNDHKNSSGKQTTLFEHKEFMSSIQK